MSKLLHRIAVVMILLCAVATASFADHTRRWRQSAYEEFLKGTPKGVAVRSDGHLELAPKFTLLADADASYLWSLRLGPGGVLYAAGASPAKVFRFEGGAKSKTVFESTDLLAQTIAFDTKGNLYVGTSPDGKVYRVSSSGEKTIFFDPKTKYIWDLAFAPDGTLYVATGDKGQIFAVAADGTSQLFYASDEAHIKILGFDGHANLLAGTEPNGRVLRVTRGAAKAKKTSPADSVAEGFVLYETAKREVTSLTVAADGTIYVAAIGEKQRTGNAAPNAVITNFQGMSALNSVASVSPQGNAPFIAFPPALTSSIYRIALDGAPEEIWSSREEVVYTLGLNSDGRLLAGTGNNGSLLVIDGRGVYAQLAKSGSAQITGIAGDPAGKVFLCTANPGKVFSLGPEYEAEGTFQSQSFDAKLFSQWGRIDWWSPPATGAAARSPRDSKEPRLEFFVRSGNTEDPGKEWSRWFGPYSTPTSVEAPAARFLQWKAVIHDGRPGDGIDWVSVAYLPKNVAPVIDGIALQEPGVRVQTPLAITGQAATVTLKQPPSANPLTGVSITNTVAAKFEQAPQGIQQKGYASVLWTAHDDNEDELRYAVYFRGENEHDWKLLKDNLDQKFYSWDTTAMPDGAYYLKIKANDNTSNPPASALKTERESERFEIDNTPPSIEKVNARAAGMNADRSHGSSYDFSFVAKDPSSSIEKAQYSLDGGDWILLAPANGISDSREEKYTFTVQHLSAGEHTISVRAFDKFENIGAGKTTIVVGP